MPLREYVCRICRIVIESIEFGEPELHRCPDCGCAMDQIAFSLPASVRVGKYGKAGGPPPEPSND